MTLIPFQKPHATAVQQISHLRAKGLLVSRPGLAARKIELIGYERLRIYFLSRRQLAAPGRPFEPGTSYQDILRIYEADRFLRSVCFAAVGQFELLFRNAMSEALSDAYGSHPYFEIAAYRDPQARLDALQLFAKLYGSSKDQRARHYQKTYSEPTFPPIWTMKEFLAFGAGSRIFGLLAGPLRSKIARQFGIASDEVFNSWLECLVDLRNMCAHHDRVFNRSFQKQPRTLKSASLPAAPSNKLKAVLECLDYMLSKRGVAASVTSEVKGVLRRFPAVRMSEAGY